MKNYRMFIAVAMALFFVGCSTIEHGSSVRQETGKILIAGVGDTMLRVDHQKDLKNIFGKADIFGRDTDTGYSSLHYAGKEDNGNLLFYRKDSEIITNESTFSQSWNPFSSSSSTTQTDVNGRINNTNGGANVSANVNSTTNTTSMAPTPDYHLFIPEGSKAIEVPSGTKKFPIANHMIEIIESTKLMVSYKLTPLNVKIEVD